MSLPPRVCSSTSALKRRPSHSSHGDSTVAIGPSSVKITPAPLQVGQAPSELELKSAGLTPLALANALRIGSSRPVYVAGLLRRDPLIAPWSITMTSSRPASEPWISELLPDPATPVTTVSRPSGTSTSTSRRLCVLAPRTSIVPVGSRTDSLSRARSSRCLPVIVPLLRRPSTSPSKQIVPPAAPAAGPMSTTWSAMRDGLRLVLDDQHGVALVAQLQEQVVHPLDVVRVQPDRRLVEDVGDVGQRRPEVADHLGALRLAARQRAGRPVEREVAQADLGERVEQVLQALEQRRDRRLLRGRAPSRRGR